MIFRRFSEPAPAARKNTTANAKQPFDARREPSLNARPASNGSTITTNAAAAQQPGPVSPHAVAQARRTQPAQTPASSFSGKDQSRKLTVGRDISLNGEIATCDHLVVEGTVSATVKGGKMLEISESGTFTGVVDIEQADIAGRFEGDLIVRGKLIVRPTAFVTGILYYNRLQVDTGATINAQLNALSTVVQEETQPQEQPVQNAYVPQTPAANNGTYAQSNDQRLFSLASLNDEPGFLRANAN